MVKNLLDKLSEFFLVLLLIITSVCFILLAPIEGHEQDTKDVKNWTIVAVNQGISHIYNGNSIETFSFYPPLNIFVFKLSAHTYQFLTGDYNLTRPEFLLAIKIPSLLFHLLTVILIYFAYKGIYKKLIVTSYALNPAIILNLAYFGEADALHTLLIVTAVIAPFTRYRFVVSIAAVLAFFTKPQAWIFMPFIALLIFLKSKSFKEVAIHLLIVVFVILLICLPFIFSDTLLNLLKSITGALGVLPNLTNHAFNFWSVFSNGAKDYVADKNLIFGLISPWGIGLFLFLTIYLIVILKSIKSHKQLSSILLLAAVLAFSYFMLLTRIHKNHIYFTLPFLVLSSGFGFARFTYAVLSLTFLFNWLLFNDLSGNSYYGFPVNFLGYIAGFLNISIFLFFIIRTFGSVPGFLLNNLNRISSIWLISFSFITITLSIVFLIFETIIVSFIKLQIESIWGEFKKTSDTSTYLVVIDSMYHQLAIIASFLGLVSLLLYAYKHIIKLK